MPLADSLASIDGLVWEDNWRAPNGEDSYVVPFPTRRPVIAVFKGDQPFSYGHYGVHLGQEDCLTFMGSREKTIRGFFLDCRQHSPTWGNRIEYSFKPSTARRLRIPAGVAHTFDSEGVFSLNTYRVLLPDPAALAAGESDWTVEGDVINVPMNASGDDVPRLVPNKHFASDVFYRFIAATQRDTLRNFKHEYPFTEDVHFDSGDGYRLMIWKRLRALQQVPEWEPVGHIDGVGWGRHQCVWTSAVSGYVAFLWERPLQIIDHGEDHYSHDAFGIHLGGDDHLTFLGPSTQKVKLNLVDMRRDSTTLHERVTFEFQPDPLRYLVIPRGVAHAFDGLENVFTINSPRLFLPEDEKDYQPGYDVIDWPLGRSDYPLFDTNKNEADDDFYSALVSAQLEMVSRPATHATPMVLMTEDSEGHTVRVALRKRLEPTKG